MGEWRLRSSSDQLYEFLREELLKGRWTGTMPGVHRLAADFQVNRKTVEAALQLLEGEGLLIGQGVGRRRRIERAFAAAAAKRKGGGKRADHGKMGKTRGHGIIS